MKPSISIIGAGTMGANIALDFAAHGLKVRLTDNQDLQLEKARSLTRFNAKHLMRRGLLSEPVASVLARIDCVSRIDDAVDGAEVVIEAVPEDLRLKRRVLADLEGRCPRRTILASNTSTFMPSLLAAELRYPERMLVTHYWNPAHLMPLVEVVPHTGTAPTVLRWVKALLQRCGKRPLLLRKEVPGFIGNRLAFALQREAMDLVAKGVASPAEIDVVASSSFGRRIPVSGIFGTADLGGLDVYLAICKSIFPDLCTDKGPPAALLKLVKQGRLGVKSGAGWSRYTAGQVQALREDLIEELVRQAKRDR
jgi:3-hydroxybutyryl-CoA dehydrogenase